MKLIDINKQEHIKFLLYPDNQPHVNITGIKPGDEVYVRCAILDSLTLIHLLQCADALSSIGAKKMILSIPYLMGARSDRVMQPGDSFDLRVVADIINLCNFDLVRLFDVHSPMALELINNSVNISNALLVDAYNYTNSVLICPDKGAVPKVSRYMDANRNLTEVVYCTKDRDLTNGNISLQVQKPEVCFNRNCVIIDDICDGGGTFLAIASQIVPKSLTLIVTHGIFSKGFTELEKSFDKIITSDSYAQGYNSPIVQIVKVHL